MNTSLNNKRRTFIRIAAGTSLALMVWLIGFVTLNMLAGAEMLVSIGIASAATASVLLILLLAGAFNAPSRSDTDALLASVEEVRQQLRIANEYLTRIGENVLVSDDTKRVAYREKDREALRYAIREDIVKQDWEAARQLVDEMEQRFGYRSEATRFRKEIDHFRKASIDEQLTAAMQHFHSLLERHAWGKASAEVQRLTVEFAEEPRIQDMSGRLETAKVTHKRLLLNTYDQAVKRSDIDGSIAILRELDQYLSTNEAAALHESARDVFKRRLHNLGIRFSVLVTERQWAEALCAGEHIMDEYPNSRMAKEVAEKLDILRMRAGAQMPVASS